MSDEAQIILAIAALLLPLKGVIWALRCPKDSPNYRLQPVRLLWWREDKEV